MSVLKWRVYPVESPSRLKSDGAAKAGSAPGGYSTLKSR